MKWWPNYCTHMDKLDGGLLGCLHFFFLRKKNSIRWKFSHILLKKVHSMHTMDTVFIIYMRCSYFLNMFILNTWYIWHVQIMYFNESIMPYFIYMLLHKIFLQIFLIVDMTVYYWCIMKIVLYFLTSFNKRTWKYLCS